MTINSSVCFTKMTTTYNAPKLRDQIFGFWLVKVCLSARGDRSWMSVFLFEARNKLTQSYISVRKPPLLCSQK